MKRIVYLLCLTLAIALPLDAQEAPKVSERDSAYKFVFTISELADGKRTNERQYSMILRERRTGKLDTGNRVPIVTTVKSDLPPSFVYMDVGLKIEGSYQEHKGNVDLDLEFEMSSMVQPEVQTESTRLNPVIRSIRQRLSGMVAPGKATVLSTLDDTASKKTFQIEVLATKLR